MTTAISGIAAAQFVGQRQAVHQRHDQIHQRKRDARIRRLDGQRLRAGLRNLDVVAFPRRETPSASRERSVVVNHQDGGTVLHRIALSAHTRRRQRQTRYTRSLRGPVRFLSGSSRHVPSTKFLAIARPRPVPLPGSFVVKNGSKTRARLAGTDTRRRCRLPRSRLDRPAASGN